MSFNLSTADEILCTIAKRLRLQRLAQNLPQRELARMAGLSLGALRKLERDGQCTLDTLVRVIQALGLVAELENLFVLKRKSIVQMEQAELASERKRVRRKMPT